MGKFQLFSLASFLAIQLFKFGYPAYSDIHKKKVEYYTNKSYIKLILKPIQWMRGVFCMGFKLFHNMSNLKQLPKYLWKNRVILLSFFCPHSSIFLPFHFFPYMYVIILPKRSSSHPSKGSRSLRYFILPWYFCNTSEYLFSVY